MMLYECPNCGIYTSALFVVNDPESPAGKLLASPVTCKECLAKAIRQVDPSVSADSKRNGKGA